MSEPESAPSFQLLTPLQGVRMRIGAGSRFLRSQRMNAFQAVASGA